MNALINNATGAVLEWGAVDYVAGPGQSVATIDDAGSFPQDTPNRYVKVVSGLFVAMSPGERVAVDLTIPQRRAQRVTEPLEIQVSTNETGSGGGWGDVIAPISAQPLLAGAYQCVCGLELALLANSATHTAQARLMLNGVEVATWQNPRSAYTRFQFQDALLFATGAAPTLALQIRRFGPGAGTARARRASIVLYPAAPILAEL